jgi:hypothetical protein
MSRFELSLQTLNPTRPTQTFAEGDQQYLSSFSTISRPTAYSGKFTNQSCSLYRAIEGAQGKRNLELFRKHLHMSFNAKSLKVATQARIYRRRNLKMEQLSGTLCSEIGEKRS